MIWHAPEPGPDYWAYRCLRCGEPVRRHAPLWLRVWLAIGGPVVRTVNAGPVLAETEHNAQAGVPESEQSAQSGPCRCTGCRPGPEQRAWLLGPRD